MHCVIIGAGWSGLAAAVELSHRGHQVTLVDSARQGGGRARSVTVDETIVDNGQHLLIGAYSKTLDLLQRLGINESEVLERLPLQLLMHRLNDPNSKPYPELCPEPSPAQYSTDLDIKVARLPAPLHMLLALLRSRGLTLSDRLRALRLCAALPLLSINDQHDVSLSTLLQRYHQSDRLIECLWEPLCLATLNTPPAIASAAVFIRVLRDAFLQRRSDCDFLIPKVDLGRMIPEPAMAMIRQRGGTVLMNTRIDALEFSARQAESRTTTEVQHAVCQDGTRISADHFILATPPYASQRLLKKHTQFEQTTTQLARFKYAPIATIYLQYPAHIRLTPVVVGLTNSIGQWLFDRRVCQQPGLMAVVISANGSHEQASTTELATIIENEIKLLFQHWPDPLWTRVIREKRATFLCETGVNNYRPTAQTAADNLWLCGDYTATGYPATLEGAVLSALDCVTAIERAAKHHSSQQQ